MTERDWRAELWSVCGGGGGGVRGGTAGGTGRQLRVVEVAVVTSEGAEVVAVVVAVVVEEVLAVVVDEVVDEVVVEGNSCGWRRWRWWQRRRRWRSSRDPRVEKFKWFNICKS